jgi:hypothetical protein
MAVSCPRSFLSIVSRTLLLTMALSFTTYASGQTQPLSTTPDTTASSKKKSSGSNCVPIDVAAQQPNQEVCVSAHVYDVVELPDGTRFLDICPADLPDDACRFTIVSFPPDRDDVGDLRRYRDQNVHIRGIVRSTHGRLGIVLSHVRQFDGGPEKFRPNPKLFRGFNGQSDRPPVRDPNLASSGRHRSFMNNRDREPVPASRKQ